MALLALLGGSPGSPLSRDKVTALLWPESTAANARASLSDTLHILRKALGEDPIVLSAACSRWVSAVQALRLDQPEA